MQLYLLFNLYRQIVTSAGYDLLSVSPKQRPWTAMPLRSRRSIRGSVTVSHQRQDEKSPELQRIHQHLLKTVRTIKPQMLPNSESRWVAIPTASDPPAIVGSELAKQRARFQWFVAHGDDKSSDIARKYADRNNMGSKVKLWAPKLQDSQLLKDYVTE